MQQDSDADANDGRTQNETASGSTDSSPKTGRLPRRLPRLRAAVDKVLDEMPDASKTSATASANFSPELRSQIQEVLRQTLHTVLEHIDNARPEELVGDNPEWFTIVSNRRRAAELQEAAATGDEEAKDLLLSLLEAVAETVGLTILQELGRQVPEELPPASLTHVAQEQSQVLKDEVLARLSRWLLRTEGEEEAEGEKAPLPVIRSPEFPIHTSQEWTALLQAATDGRHDLHYTNDVEAGARIHLRPNAPFHTRLGLLDGERSDQRGMDLLRRLTDRLDIDAAFALLYISHCIAPPRPLPDNAYAGGWVDLNDVANKIGLRADTAAEAEDNRRLVWDYIRFGARASIVGSRTTSYVDPRTKKNIETRIDTPLWTVLK
jgi:hypothetical protein